LHKCSITDKCPQKNAMSAQQYVCVRNVSKHTRLKGKGILAEMQVFRRYFFNKQTS